MDSKRFCFMSKNNKIKKKIGKYGIDYGERGVYDKRNKLNELTGKEWVYFTNSIWITGYSPTAIENIGLKHRKIHPSPKPPGLLKDIILFFTKSKATILDPFVGVGGTLLGTALAGGKRKAIGIDLEEKYRNAYLEACREENLEVMDFIIGDSYDILKNKIAKVGTKFDLIIADPPYSDMMAKSRTGQKLKLYNKNDASPFTRRKEDLGNMKKNEYLIKLREIIELSTQHLKDDKYLILFCKDFQPDKENVNMLHYEVVNEIKRIGNIYYKGMRIWHDQAMSLYPFGYPYSFVMNQIHQYILIFRKENEPKK